MNKASKIVVTITIVLLTAFIFLIYKYQHYSIPTSAMSLTINPGDLVLVDKTHNSIEDIERNDVVIFHFPLEDTVIAEFPDRYYEQLLRDHALDLKVTIDVQERLFIVTIR